MTRLFFFFFGIALLYYMLLLHPPASVIQHLFLLFPCSSKSSSSQRSHFVSFGLTVSLQLTETARDLDQSHEIILAPASPPPFSTISLPNVYSRLRLTQTYLSSSFDTRRNIIQAYPVYVVYVHTYILPLGNPLHKTHIFVVNVNAP